MVGLVQKKIRRQQEGSMDQKQRIDNDLTASEHIAVHLPSLLRQIFDRNARVDIRKLIHHLLDHQSSGHAFRLLVQKHS